LLMRIWRNKNPGCFNLKPLLRQVAWRLRDMLEFE
jgi:hypothetical protein